MKRPKPPPQSTLFDLEHPPLKPVATPVEAASEVPQGTTPLSVETEEAPSLSTLPQEPPLEAPLPSPVPESIQEPPPEPPLLSGPPHPGEAWVGLPVACSVCGEILPTLRHLDLLHDSHGENLRQRLLTAYLWPSHRVRAEALGFSVAQLRELILLGGFVAIEKALTEKERKPE